MKKLFATIVNFFHCNKIVYTTKWQPGTYIKRFAVGKQLYFRIAFSNRRKYPGMLPITDVKIEDVRFIRRQPSEFHKWFYGLFGKTPKEKDFIINPDKI